jgi:hypothetical protein
MTLLLSNDDAAKVLTMADRIAALEALYLDLGNGSAVYRGRTDLFAPTNADIGIDVPAAHQFKLKRSTVRSPGCRRHPFASHLTWSRFRR